MAIFRDTIGMIFFPSINDYSNQGLLITATFLQFYSRDTVPTEDLFCFGAHGKKPLNGSRPRYEEYKISFKWINTDFTAFYRQ